MGEFIRCIDYILAEEGGLSNHRQDPGGLTRYGISQRSYPHVDIANLTIQQASGIYLNDYWNPIRGHLLPHGLDLLVFDCAVNQGSTTAAILLQTALGIKADGSIGPITITRASQAMPDVLITFATERALRYEMNRNEQTFGRGWYRRLFRIYTLALKAYNGSND